MRFFDLLKDVFSDLDIRARSTMHRLWVKSEDSRRTSIWNHGFSLEKEFVSMSSCFLLKEEIDMLLSNPSIKVWRDDFNSDNRIYGFESVSKWLKKSVDISQIMTLGEQYLGKKITEYFVLGARLEAKAGNPGSGGGWHRDSAFSHQYKAIIYLDNVEPSNGPFEYITGSHRNLSKWFSFPNTRLNQTRYHENEIGNKAKRLAVSITAPIGSVIFVDTRGVHRGKPIKTGKRYALTFYFYTHKIPGHIKSQLNIANTILK